MKLRTRLSIAALATAAAAGGTGAFLVSPASAAATVHRLGFTSVQQSNVNFSQNAGLQQDKDLNHAGHVVGFDTLRFYLDPKTKSEKFDVTVSLKGGVIYGVLGSPATQVIHGTVTGGTGIYHGAKGTVTAKTSNNGGNTAVTITYHT